MVDLTDIKAGLILTLIYVIPIIPVGILWILLGPAGFWQLLAMAVISIPLYIFFGLIELLIISVMKR